MAEAVPVTSPSPTVPNAALPTCLDEEVTARILRVAADVTLVVDGQGVIESVLAGEAPGGGAGLGALQGSRGRRFADLVAAGSRAGAEQLLDEARRTAAGCTRELDVMIDAATTAPVRCSAVLLDRDGRVAVVGRDLRSFVTMQRQMLSAQQAMDREYGRLRETETRYRLLYQVGGDPALVVEADSLRVVEWNPAAAELLDGITPAPRGRSLLDLFTPRHLPALQGLLAAVEAGGRAADLDLELLGAPRVTVSAHLFRQGGFPLLLVRLAPIPGGSDALRGSAGGHGSRSARLLAVVDALPEGFVLVGDDQRVISANPAFCELVHAGSEGQLVGEPLDHWLGRPGVDLPILLSSLREHGTVRNFSTIIRGQFGAPQEATVSAAAAFDARVPCIGFSIRTVPARLRVLSPLGLPVVRSPDQVRELVGRAPLRAIVRESAEIIERLCIEAALGVSGDNRASAAQLLGLSRQGLYSKLRRYGLGDLDRDN